MEKIKTVFSLLNPKEKKKFLVLITLMFFATILEIASISAFIPTISILLKGDLEYFFEILKLNPTTIQLDQEQLIYFSLSLIVIIFLAKTIFLIFYTWFNSSFYFNVGKRLSAYLFNIYLNLPYLSHLNKKNSKLIFNCTEGVEIYRNGLMHVSIILNEIIIFTGLIIFLTIIDHNSVILLGTIFAFLTFAIFYLNKNKNFYWGKKVKEHENNRINTMIQSLGAIKDVKIKNIENFFIKEFDFNNYLKAKFSQLNDFFTTIPRFFFEFVLVLAIFLLIVLYMNAGYGYDLIILKLGIFSVAAFRLYPSTFRIINSFQRYNFCLPVVESLKSEVMSNEKFFKENQNTKNYEKFKFEKLEINDVYFKYPENSKWVINGLNLSLKENEMIGISGITGSGKTTLIDIITGLLIPEKGEFVLNGNKENKLPDYWIRNIAYIPQNIALINDSIEKNITFGDDENKINNANLKNVIANSQLEKFVSSLPEGLNTSIGERGLKISGGEKQRIGIARALFSNKKILILDEATNALDKVTEDLILKFLKNEKNNKTIIMISHEKNTLKFCDRLYEFKGGILENYVK